ncbi:MAG: ATP-binding protein [Clostridiales bacterium]|jgi:DNA replication protein DnaC|nr:ATP-binding protein [Clostridiales bacterium]
MRNLILSEILQEYDELRTREREALRQRENHVTETIPEIAVLRRTIIELMARRSLEIIKNPNLSGQTIDELEKKINELKERERDLLIQHGLPPDYLSMHYRCPQCEDTGYRGDIIKEKCSCLIQKLVERTYQLSDIKELDRENFDTFDPEVFPDAPIEGSKLTQREYMIQLKNRLMDYAKKFPDNRRKTILFSGKTGLGKTFLLNCMAKTILNMGYTVMRISAYKLFNQLFLSALQDNEENQFLFNCLFEVDALIIDDLGTETQRNNFTSEDLFNILNERFTQEKHTFLSTNLGLAELKDRYSDRIASRLFDTSNTILIKFVGQDIRLRARN